MAESSEYLLTGVISVPLQSLVYSVKVYEYGQSCFYVYTYLYMRRCICICVDMYMCMNMFHACPYVYIYCVYILYDYVQRCGDTVSVELRYIN